MHLPMLHPTLGRDMPKPVGPKAVPSALEAISGHHARALRAALKATLREVPLSRKEAVTGFALVLETPRDSLASRLIDLAPIELRPMLREQIL